MYTEKENFFKRLEAISPNTNANLKVARPGRSAWYLAECYFVPLGNYYTWKLYRMFFWKKKKAFLISRALLKIFNNLLHAAELSH